MNGYNTAGAFKGLSSETEINELINLLNNTVRDVAKRPDNDEVKIKINKSLAAFYLLASDSFTLPDGHSKLMKFIARYYSTSNSVIYINEVGQLGAVQPVEQNLIDRQAVEAKLTNIAESYITKMNIKIPRIHNMEIKTTGIDTYIRCCFCNTDVKVFIDKGIKASNFKRHLDREHVEHIVDEANKQVRVLEDIRIKDATDQMDKDDEIQTDEPTCSKYLKKNYSETKENVSEYSSLLDGIPPRKKIALQDNSVENPVDTINIRKKVSILLDLL